MRVVPLMLVCAALAGCAGGGSPADQARNAHDLGVLDNTGLALRSQVGTDAANLDAIARRVAPAATP